MGDRLFGLLFLAVYWSAAPALLLMLMGRPLVALGWFSGGLVCFGVGVLAGHLAGWAGRVEGEDV